MSSVPHVAGKKDEGASLGRQMSRWMDQVLGRNFGQIRPSESWQPAVNVCEHDTYFCVIVELAGVKAGEIDLRAEEKTLVLSGERAMPDDEQPRGGPVRIHLMEIDHGHFYRAVELPPGVDIDAIEAFYRNGYLWVRVPKTV
ncbi:MAG TPA: Hsp20/alpha crystallin family protein [Phycisphaerae bacterium]|nr:Hsp20/alpha crystallin family protein [Phycisphaerae bacterium]